MTSATAIRAPGPISAKKPKSRRETIINFRVSYQTRELFDAAAEVLGKTRTQFVVDSAQKHAVDVLLDQRMFRLDDKGFEMFMAVLDNPPRPNERLKKLMAEKAPWEA